MEETGVFLRNKCKKCKVSYAGVEYQPYGCSMDRANGKRNAFRPPPNRKPTVWTDPQDWVPGRGFCLLAITAMEEVCIVSRRRT